MFKEQIRHITIWLSIIQAVFVLLISFIDNGTSKIFFESVFSQIVIILIGIFFMLTLLSLLAIDWRYTYVGETNLKDFIISCRDNELNMNTKYDYILWTIYKSVLQQESKHKLNNKKACLYNIALITTGITLLLNIILLIAVLRGCI